MSKTDEVFHMENMYYATILLILTFFVSIVLVIVVGINEVIKWFKLKRSERKLRKEIAKKLESIDPMTQTIQEGVKLN